MEKEERTSMGAKRPHPLAQKLEVALRERLMQRRDELNLSDDALGKRAFRPLGYKDVQKKVNNLLRGQTSLLMSEFYILCEALDLQPDRVFSTAIDDTLRAIEAEKRSHEGAQAKKEAPQIEEPITGRPIQPFGFGTGIETNTLGGKE